MKRRGFTLIELLLYVGIVGFVIGAILIFAWDVVGLGVKNSVQQETYSTARYLAQRIVYTIRNATALTSVSASSVVLDGTTIDLVSGKVRLNGVNLNSDTTSVSNLTFSQTGSEIMIAFTVTYAGPRSEYQASTSVRTSASVRTDQ